MIYIPDTGKIDTVENNMKIELFKNPFRRRENPGRRSADLNAERLRAERDALLKEIPIAIFYLDTDLRYTSVSQAFANSVGLTISNVIGKTAFDLFPENLAAELQKKYRCVLQTGESIDNLNFSVTNQNDQQIYFSTALAPFYGNNGRISGLVGVSSDISKLTEANLDIAKTSMDNHKLLTENRLLTHRLYETQENERRHIARELHDELGQWLTALRAELQVVIGHVEQDSTVYDRVQSIKEIANNMHTVVHDMLQELRPVMLEKLGLADSLCELQSDWRKHHRHINFELMVSDDIGDPGAVDKTISITIYRMVQESLNNVCKHAQAGKVVVQLSREKSSSLLSDTLLLSVEDDGIGFDVDQKSAGFGLLGMRERAIAAGGEFLLQSSPGTGVQITARLPLKL
ncbi:PAS domain-containing protein [Nitrosomonas mobilis]|uniref:Oxygen sensor histidine kinase NreB n=1 Tax=Nitrosomonas mobilis TaxID=51642 RepID=A0A1G5SFM5_9PROT